MNAMKKLLLVEDAQEVAEVIFDYFEDEPFELDYASTGTQGLQLALNERYDCIVLDIMLPGLDGISVCRQLREMGNNVPIIMLTARDTPQDELAGLQTGADDYIVKPFDLTLLEARIQSVIRRSSGAGFKKRLECGSLEIDVSTHQVWREGQELQLSPSGFKILRLLMERFPQVVTREELENMLWPDEVPDQDVLRKHIYQLRSKVDKPFVGEVIKTVPKSGYKLIG